MTIDNFCYDVNFETFCITLLLSLKYKYCELYKVKISIFEIVNGGKSNFYWMIIFEINVQYLLSDSICKKQIKFIIS